MVGHQGPDQGETWEVRRLWGRLLSVPEHRSRSRSMRQHDERDVAIPADPASDLVVIQAHILGRFKIFVG